MRDRVQIAERRGVREHNSAERLTIEFTVLHRVREAIFDLAQKLRAALKQLMVDRIAVEYERTHGFKLLQRSRFPAAGAAGYADYLHPADKRIGNILSWQRPLTEDAVRGLTQVYYRGLTAKAASAAVDNSVYLSVKILKHLTGILGTFLT